MRKLLFVAISLSVPALGACEKAAAATNDEMAHCIAAFHYGRQFWLNQSPPNYQTLPPLTAGSIYYAQKLKAAGVADGGQAAATAFIQKNVSNSKFMADTLRRCGEQQAKDPEFVRQFVSLTRLAQKIDPVCRANPGVCAKRR